MTNPIKPDTTYFLTNLHCDWDQIETKVLLAGHHDAGGLTVDHPLLRGHEAIRARAEQITERSRRAAFEAENPEARS